MKLRLSVGLCVWCSLGLAIALRADDATTAPSAEAAARESAQRQIFIQQQFKTLMVKMTRLAGMLEKSDPQSARALRDAVNIAGREDIASDMEKVAAALEKGLMGAAANKESDVIAQLQRVLDAIRGSRQDDLETFKRWSKLLGEMIPAEKGLAGECSAGKADPAKALPKQVDITKQIERLLEEMFKKDQEGSREIPGLKSVKKASETATGAQTKLRHRDLKGAGTDQEKTVAGLTEAKTELDRVLTRIEYRRQGELLASLAQKLQEILEAQKPITTGTRNIDERRKGQSALERPDELKCLQMSGGEDALSTKTREILKLLDGDGTTAVFPEVLQQVAGDLGELKGMLSSWQTGQLTQAMQTDVEKNLQELIDALKAEAGLHRRHSSEPDRTGPPDPTQDPPTPPDKRPRLVSLTAELKMLRALQRQINQRTSALAKEPSPPSAQTKAMCNTLAQRQKKVEDLARDMAGKVAIRPAPLGPGR